MFNRDEFVASMNSYAMDELTRPRLAVLDPGPGWTTGRNAEVDVMPGISAVACICPVFVRNSDCAKTDEVIAKAGVSPISARFMIGLRFKRVSDVVASRRGDPPHRYGHPTEY
jgi:hypothetical protein